MQQAATENGPGLVFGALAEPRSGGPVASSTAQTFVAVVALIVFSIGGFDSILQLFTWLSGLAAVGLVVLMAAPSASVVGYFARRPR